MVSILNVLDKNKTEMLFSSPLPALELYCKDDLKRPRKDDWDEDSEDEIISAYCTHNGDISIPMNPGG